MELHLAPEYDSWFGREVEIGIAEADRGEFLAHEEVGLRLAKLHAEKQSH
jgi:predicted transcriptional regulator